MSCTSPAFIPSNCKELDQRLNSLLEYPSQLGFHRQDKQTQTYRSKTCLVQNQITRGKNSSDTKLPIREKHTKRIR